MKWETPEITVVDISDFVAELSGSYQVACDHLTCCC